MNAMAIQKRLYTVDDFLELPGWDGTRDRKYELIDGELSEISPANILHALFASRVDRMIGNYAEEMDLGYSFVEAGFFLSNDRHNVYAPDVAFISKARMPDPIPQAFVSFMPDLAVEIASPSNSMRELRQKAEFYLRNGTRLVWIVYPDRASAEVCRLDDERFKIESVGRDGKLVGEAVLSGFELPLSALFPAESA